MNPWYCCTLAFSHSVWCYLHLSNTRPEDSGFLGKVSNYDHESTRRHIPEDWIFTSTPM
jgi:hypothetical protein